MSISILMMVMVSVVVVLITRKGNCDYLMMVM